MIPNEDRISINIYNIFNIYHVHENIEIQSHNEEPEVQLMEVSHRNVYNIR